MCVGTAGGDLQRFLEDRWFKVQKLAGEGDEPFTPYALRSIVFFRYPSFKKRHAVESSSRS